MTDLVRKNLERSLAVTSLDDLVRAKTSEEAVLLVDGSGSMDSRMRNGKTRYEGLKNVVTEIRQTHGQVKMIGFGLPYEQSGDLPEVNWTPVVPEPHGGTPIHSAIEFARRAGVGRCVLISDGAPDNGPKAMDAARAFGGRIDVVFVGNPGEHGERFLAELASVTGGTSFTGDLSEPKQLGKGVVALLTGGDSEDEE